jgi:hypothetical protein
VNTATIHDGFFTNIVDSTDAKWALRRIYADAVEGQTLLRTLKEMRKQGLSKESYERLLKEAEELGLLNPKDGITAEDILELILEGEDWYGIGP